MNSKFVRLTGVAEIGGESLISVSSVINRMTSILDVDDKGFWNLEEGAYHFDSSDFLSLNTEVAHLCVNSEFLFNGVMFFPNVFGPYEYSNIGGLMLVKGGPVKIEKGIIIGELKIIGEE